MKIVDSFNSAELPMPIMELVDKYKLFGRSGYVGVGTSYHIIDS
jgi:hypothetical protein